MSVCPCRWDLSPCVCTHVCDCVFVLCDYVVSSGGDAKK